MSDGATVGQGLNRHLYRGGPDEARDRQSERFIAGRPKFNMDGEPWKHDPWAQAEANERARQAEERLRGRYAFCLHLVGVYRRLAEEKAAEADRLIGRTR